MSHYVYRFLDCENEVLYIGETKNLEKRIKSHFSNKGSNVDAECYSRTDKVEFIYFKNETDALIFEIYYINKTQAFYNKRGKTSVIPTPNEYLDEIAKTWIICETFNLIERKESILDFAFRSKTTKKEKEHILKEFGIFIINLKHGSFYYGDSESREIKEKELINNYSVEKIRSIANQTLKKKDEIEKEYMTVICSNYILHKVYLKIKSLAEQGINCIIWRYNSKQKYIEDFLDDEISLIIEKIDSTVNRNKVINNLVECLKICGFTANTIIDDSSSYLYISWS